MINITDCDKEPIHIPGLIQPHGMLFVISKTTFNVEQVSDNVETYIGLKPEEVLNTPFLNLFQETLTQKDIQTFLRDFRSTKHLSLLNNRALKVLRVEAIAHEYDDCLIVELEPSEKEKTDLHDVFNGVGCAVSEMQQTKDLFELCQKATDEVQRLSGYDRVMLYRFDENWNGNVIAETLSSPDIDTYMNHWFPSSDIPAQARQMLADNWLRSIPDVNFKPSKIIPQINPRTKRSLNLGKSIFRSPSPIHLEYLRNMNVGGTLTISIKQENKLWGLIACHHNSPKPIKHDERISCQFIGQIVSAMISSREVYEDFEYSQKLDVIFNQLFEFMSSNENFVEGIVKNSPNLLDLTSAEGAAAAIYFEDEWTILGKTPSILEITELVDWIRKTHSGKDVFYTDSLPLLYPPALNYKHIAAGVIAISIPKGQRNFILWFRPEVTQTVTWAGDPKKSIELEQGTLTLHPRKSFEAWKQDLNNHSAPWKKCEVEAARKMRRALIEFDLSRQFRRFQELADSVDQFVWTATPEGHIDYYNKRWYEITGLPNEVRNNEARKIVVHPEDLDRVNKLWAHALKNGTPYNSELRIKDKDGNFKWFLSKAVPVKDQTGQVLKWYGSATNIEALKETEMALQNAINGRDDFISVASHELKTPITSIKMLLQMIDRSLKKDNEDLIAKEKIAYGIGKASRELKKIETLIDDLLNVTKIKSGQLDYDFERHDLTELIKDVLESFGENERLVTARKSILVTPAVVVNCDRFRMEQVITNLISNALKYGGERPVEVKVTKEEKFARLSVMDQGLGISKENQSLIFNRFERAVYHKGISGLGLGLYITKKIVEAHKGKIKIESELNQGSTFTVELPL